MSVACIHCVKMGAMPKAGNLAVSMSRNCASPDAANVWTNGTPQIPQLFFGFQFLVQKIVCTAQLVLDNAQRNPQALGHGFLRQSFPSNQ
ncbi:hypothetical protein PCO31110_02123 [Pandoraea communis]|uniref:Uncharacterized protein n=1 Tax=Pandoraea communis TaxID=2508297 RepID=A0A5E4ULU1_9BURK|nr:hypothetical protein PCO31110_02123 [Pandoraea communis]